MPDANEGNVHYILLITIILGEGQTRTMFSIANEGDISDNTKYIIFDTTTSKVRMENWSFSTGKHL